MRDCFREDIFCLRSLLPILAPNQASKLDLEKVAASRNHLIRL